MALTTTLAAEPPLTHDKRLRRCMILCCTVARNLAYHRARRKEGFARPDEDFWDTADANFIDAAILAWCALFADDNLERAEYAKHSWRKILPAEERDEFERGLLAAMGLRSEGFAELIKVCRRYRDKFLAHLDSDLTMVLPHMEAALRGAAYYYECLLVRFEDPRECSDTVSDLATLYDWAFNEGLQAWSI